MNIPAKSATIEVAMERVSESELPVRKNETSGCEITVRIKINALINFFFFKSIIVERKNTRLKTILEM